MQVAGIDGWKKGWVAVVAIDGRFERAATYSDFGDALSGLSSAQVIAVDIPIGTPVEGHRKADEEAREFVGLRRSSVFFTPPRAVMEAPSYEEARRVAEEDFGSG